MTNGSAMVGVPCEVAESDFLEKKMDLLDKLAFMGRRFEKQVAPSTGSTRFQLADLMQMFGRTTILELTPTQNGKPLPTVTPDPVRKIKVSLLDQGISAIHSHSEDWFEVYRTAPSGDLSKVRIVAYAPDSRKVGQIDMLVSQRLPYFYFGEDPILAEIAKR